MKSLLITSLVGSILGILLITLLANNLEPKLKSISDVDERNLEEIVKLQGKVVLVKEYETLTVFTLEDETGKIDSVFYEKIEIKKNQTVEVIGKIVEYKGKIEIEANKIEFL
jgi:RecJ-like exonuclease